MQRLFTPSLARRYEEFYKDNGVKFLKVLSLTLVPILHMRISIEPG